MSTCNIVIHPENNLNCTLESPNAFPHFIRFCNFPPSPIHETTLPFPTPLKLPPLSLPSFQAKHNWVIWGSARYLEYPGDNQRRGLGDLMTFHLLPESLIQGILKSLPEEARKFGFGFQPPPSVFCPPQTVSLSPFPQRQTTGFDFVSFESFH